MMERIEARDLLTSNKEEWDSSLISSFFPLFFGSDVFCKTLWHSKLHPYLKLFLWKVFRDALPIGSRLAVIFGVIQRVYVAVVSVVVKDNSKHIIALYASKIKAWDPYAGELHSLLHGVKVIQQLGIDHCVLISDFLSLVQVIAGREVRN
ncbi:hypothetical protein G4B88_025232 [Cannabis sativa]|uniref:RNase H type-1 domain-containing protein n=1 Tax=Cannabis sativa TaxID=3483 RepID=A0A7J6DVR5_CANSA|nr:hypothetical protein G4B88_025232 [Cannabis sativa]